MKWHVVCRIGDGDTYLPDLDGAIEKLLVLHFSGGAPNEEVREKVLVNIEEKCEKAVSSKAQDFLFASMGAYLADLCIPRRTADDRWSREFTLHLPVFETARWEKASRLLESALKFLSGDHWTISTRERTGEAPEPEPIGTPDSTMPSRVCLLSGGLDSLAGAIDLLSGGNSVSFVSHHGGGMTSKFQNSIFSGLSDHYPEQCFKNQFYVVPPKLGAPGENSMRSRSILFLGLGVTLANTLGDDVPLVVPENGLISLNVPLTGPRVGSSSTRTTHPHFIAEVRKVLSELDIPNTIELPYRHMTKGEMLAKVSDSESLESLIGLSMSCSHPEVARWKGASPGTHCGYCFPCLIRRAAVSMSGFDYVDATYTYDATHDELPGKRGRDLRALKMALARDRKTAASSTLRALSSGPLPPEELSKFGDVYKRGMSVLDTFLNGGT